jgi:TolB protein
MKRIHGALLLALAGASYASSAWAQRSAPPGATPPQQAVARPSVLILPVARDRHDSIRTILERDLDNGDVLEVLRVESDQLRQLVAGVNPPILQPDSVAQLGARFVVRAERLLDTLRITVFDTTTRGVPATRSFPVVSAPPDRARFVHDSLAQFYADRERVSRDRLAALSVTYDSLLRASRGRQPRNMQQRAIEVVRRDSMFTAIAAEGTRLHAEIARFPVERDSLLRVRVPQEQAVYDSLSYVERMMLHAAADELQHWLTGIRGVAASRIAFLRGSLLYVVDADGANERQLTVRGRALSPAWHPSGRWIVYSDITDVGTQVAEVDVGTGEVRLLKVTPRGYNITPVYTPDGKRIVFAASGTGGSQLVSVDRESSRITRLGTQTRNASSPTFSPDGRRIAFVIPRTWQGSGSTVRMTPQLFTATATGTGIQQLTATTFGVRSYRTSPEWSPDGRYIAYTQQGGGFQVWLIGANDRRSRQLTSGRDHEDASWAPDSRHLVITAGRDQTDLMVLDIVTGRTRQLVVDGRLAAWGPRWDPSQPLVRRGSIYATNRDD